MTVVQVGTGVIVNEVVTVCTVVTVVISDGVVRVVRVVTVEKKVTEYCYSSREKVSPLETSNSLSACG